MYWYFERLKTELEQVQNAHAEELQQLVSRHNSELSSLQEQLTESETLRSQSDVELSSLRERLEAERAQRSLDEKEFLEELRSKYDRDMATLQEEYGHTKSLLESVSDILLLMFVIKFNIYILSILKVQSECIRYPL
jgi:septal ring factor EnvC (AmiA/AmiB activator)